MAWRDNLLDASLDGVPFFYEEVDTKVGRRGELHEFPGRDEPYVEDVGRAARKWQVRAYVLGEDYADTRDALIEVIESEGEHVFVHPYRGEFTVRILGEVTINEKVDQGRYATFDLQLVEAGSDFVLVREATASKLKVLKLEALDELATKTKLSLAGAIADVLASVANAINAAASAVRKVNGKIAAALNLVDDITAALDAFTREIDTLLGTPQDLINKLGALYDAAFDLVATFVPPATKVGVREPVFDLVDLATRSLRDLFDFETQAEAIPNGTEQSELEVQAHAQVQATVKASALATGVALLATLDLESAAQAQALADEVAGYFDEVLEADLEVDVHETFATMKAATVQHFASLARSLPDVTTYTPATTVPALVLAHALYGDASRDDDIIRRNGIRHPLFVAGGVELEVLADG